MTIRAKVSRFGVFSEIFQNTIIHVFYDIIAEIFWILLIEDINTKHDECYAQIRVEEFALLIS